MHYLGSFVLQDMLLSLYIFAFDGQNMKFSESMLAFYIVTCPAVYLELFISWGFLSRISFLASFVHVFLRRRRSFTSRKLSVYLEPFLCFLQLSDRAYMSFKLDV